MNRYVQYTQTGWFFVVSLPNYVSLLLFFFCFVLPSQPGGQSRWQLFSELWRPQAPDAGAEHQCCIIGSNSWSSMFMIQTHVSKFSKKIYDFESVRFLDCLFESLRSMRREGISRVFGVIFSIMDCGPVIWSWEFEVKVSLSQRRGLQSICVWWVMVSWCILM